MRGEASFMAAGSDGDRKVPAVLCDWYLTQDSLFRRCVALSQNLHVGIQLKNLSIVLRGNEKESKCSCIFKRSCLSPDSYFLIPLWKEVRSLSDLICLDLPCGNTARCLVVELGDSTNKRTRNIKSTQNRFDQFKVTEGTILAASRKHGITNKKVVWLMNSLW